MRVLVTGAGFIASHTVPRLLARGYSVTLLDRRDLDSESTRSWASGCRILKGDVCDRPLIQDLVSKHDGVIHLAGVLGTSEMIEDPYPAVRINIEGTLNLLEACRPAPHRPDGVPAVLTSVGNHGMLNTYAITKKCAERLALMYNRELGTRAAVVRAYNAYGERQRSGPVRKLVPSCVALVQQGRPIEVFGSGEQRIDLVSVKDVAEVLCRALTVPHDSYDQVFEAGTGYPVTVNEVAAFIERMLGREVGIRHLPMRPGEPDMSEVVADPKTLAPLGVDPGHLIRWKEGLGETLDWYRNHPEFLAGSANTR